MTVVQTARVLIAVTLLANTTPTLAQTSRIARRESFAGYEPSTRLPLTQPRVLWKFVCGSPDSGNTATTSLSDVTCSEGVVYFGDEAGNLFAYVGETGQRLWNRNLGSRLGTPSVDHARVFVTNDDVGVTAVSRETGDVLWTHPINYGALESSPIAIADALFVSGYDGFARALNVETGKEVWRHDLKTGLDPAKDVADGKRGRLGDKPARPRGSTSDGKLFLQAVFDQSRIVAIDCSSGERKWAFQMKGWTADGPIIAENRVYIGSQDEYLYCLDYRTGELLWKFKTPTWLASKPAVHGGFVYQPSHRGRLFKLNAKTGDVVWKFEPPDVKERESMVYSFPIVTDNTAYFAAGTGWIYAVNSETGELRWKLQPSPESEIFSSLDTDGDRLFLMTRPKHGGGGENSVIAIGL
jgi:outer membrane protein assembly factor BamB